MEMLSPPSLPSLPALSSPCHFHASPISFCLDLANPCPLSRPAMAPVSCPFDETDNMGGKMKRVVLSEEGRTKLNAFPDCRFYSVPRFVTHFDDGFVSNLTQLYRKLIPAGSEVLDMMSSWASHLPPDVKYNRVLGHGLNAAELAGNDRLDHFFVKDLNEDPAFEVGNAQFDAVLCAVSVQYLQQPEKVFSEIYRVLRPGGVCIVSFSNRMFFQKAIAAWRNGSPYSRTRLVLQYFQCVSGFTQPEVIKQLPFKVYSEKDHQSPIAWLLNLLEPATNDPFYAVISYKNFKPIFDS